MGNDLFVLAVSAGSRGWQSASPDDGFDLLRYLDVQGKGTKTVHGQSCLDAGSAVSRTCLRDPGIRMCTRYTAEPIRTGLILRWRTAMKASGKEEE